MPQGNVRAVDGFAATAGPFGQPDEEFSTGVWDVIFYPPKIVVSVCAAIQYFLSVIKPDTGHQTQE